MEDINGKDALTIITAVGAAVLDYFIQHPATALTTVIMLMVAWERYKAKKSYRKYRQLKEQKEEVALNTAKLREMDLIARMKAQDEEDAKIRKEKENE